MAQTHEQLIEWLTNKHRVTVRTASSESHLFAFVALSGDHETVAGGFGNAIRPALAMLAENLAKPPEEESTP